MWSSVKFDCLIGHILDNESWLCLYSISFIYLGKASTDLVMAILVVDLDAGENGEISFTLEQNLQNYFNIKSIEQSGKHVVKVCTGYNLFSEF